jgi:hypothetical protein
VGHEAARQRAVPVILTRLEKDAATRRDDLDRRRDAAQPGALRAVDLVLRMGVQAVRVPVVK